MSEIHQQYKALVLRAARFATAGGAMSQTFEDFLIDNVDRLVDGLDEMRLLTLLREGINRICEIDSSEAYNAGFEIIASAEKCLTSTDLLPDERSSMVSMIEVLREIGDDFKIREWDLEG